MTGTANMLDDAGVGVYDAQLTGTGRRVKALFSDKLRARYFLEVESVADDEEIDWQQTRAGYWKAETDRETLTVERRVVRDAVGMVVAEPGGD